MQHGIDRLSHPHKTKVIRMAAVDGASFSVLRSEQALSIDKINMPVPRRLRPLIGHLNDLPSLRRILRITIEIRPRLVDHQIV